MVNACKPLSSETSGVHLPPLLMIQRVQITRSSNLCFRGRILQIDHLIASETLKPV